MLKWTGAFIIAGVQWCLFQPAKSQDGTVLTKVCCNRMEVYTYVLNVEFTDGRKYKKTGDITLIR